MRIDSPTLANNTILTGSLEVTGSVVPGDNSLYDFGSTSKRWRSIYSTSFSGSLTKLASGADYLVAGSGIQLTTGSLGDITIASTATTSPGGLDSHVQFKDGSTFGGNSGLTYNKTAQALTGTYIVASTGFSGSLTKLSTGGDYLVAGSGIQLSTGSTGAVTITATVAGSSLVAGSNTQVQFNNGGTFGADSNFTFNSTTDTLSVTNISGSLTRLTSGQPYLVAGSGITIATGSNGSVTMSLGALSYATATFTNATSVTVNHSVGTTLYDIEVFDTSYNKILPGTATATSPTQSNLTFAIPTSGFVAVGGPTAGSQGASVYAPLLTGSTYLASDTSVPANTLTNLLSFTLPSAGTWDVTYFVNLMSQTTTGYAKGQTYLYDSNGTLVPNSEVNALYVNGSIYAGDSNSGRIILNTTGAATYTLRVQTSAGSQTCTAVNGSGGRTGVIWTSLGNSTVVGGITTTTGSAPYYGARAWVNFNGTGTVAIRGSSNVTSITDNGVGDYTVNFTTAMEDTSYAVLGTTIHGAAIADVGVIGVRGTASAATLKSTTQVRLDNTYASNTGAGYYDSAEVSVTIFR